MPEFTVYVERKIVELGEVRIKARGLKEAGKKVQDLIKSEDLVVEQWEHQTTHFRPFGGERFKPESEAGHD